MKLTWALKIIQFHHRWQVPFPNAHSIKLLLIPFVSIWSILFWGFFLAKFSKSAKKVSKWPKSVFSWFSSCQIPKKKIFWKYAKFPYWVLECSHKCGEYLNFLLKYPVYSQISLNCLMEDCHFSYIAKKEKKTP